MTINELDFEKVYNDSWGNELKMIKKLKTRAKFRFTNPNPIGPFTKRTVTYDIPHLKFITLRN